MDLIMEMIIALGLISIIMIQHELVHYYVARYFGYDAKVLARHLKHPPVSEQFALYPEDIDPDQEEDGGLVQEEYGD